MLRGEGGTFSVHLLSSGFHAGIQGMREHGALDTLVLFFIAKLIATPVAQLCHKLVKIVEKSAGTVILLRSWELLC